MPWVVFILSLLLCASIYLRLRVVELQHRLPRYKNVAMKIASLPRKLHGNPEGSYRWKSVRKSLASDSDIIASDVRMLYIDRKLARSTRAFATLDKTNSIRFLRMKLSFYVRKKDQPDFS